MINIKSTFISTGIVMSFLLSATPAFAHVIVKPSEAGVAAFQTFTMGVPSEKDNPTVALRLVIPDGLQSVSPNVKPGWTIDIKKQGSGDDAKVTEIDWTGGSIPAGQRDDFIFSAQVPSKETSLQWKAFQTYEDGSVVSWDQNPDSMKNLSDEQMEANEKKGLGPYSMTNVINDLTPSTSPGRQNRATKESLPTVLSIVAIALALGALYNTRKKK
jgi:uncharacterized protein YcnI